MEALKVARPRDKVSNVGTVEGTTEFVTRDGDRTLTVAGGTEIGRRYRANFDVLHLGDDPVLAVVADGMGDSEGSAVASRTAVDVVVAALRAAHRPFGPATIRDAVGAAQQRVRAAGERLDSLTGCTLTAFVPDGDGAAWIAQIGDSRAYRLRDGLLELLTVDHTAAWLGAVYGWYPADSRQAAAARYMLHRFLGHPDSPEPDVLNVTLRPGDVYCLCTDGVAEQVSYERLQQVLGSGDRPGEMVAALLADTLAAGGHDNATLAILQIT
ncbi:protein phosphatase [Phytohabitans aurantiacus]|uniref:Protein phosphatase n=1 Tax=Phytohabitans aurantiacus TaxID=3016789 RepID=A0ABQ5QYE2_9ACTN|nr:protein phosphatase [Phytohabitans aurantiacus]